MAGNELWAWGYNNRGQLGDGTNDDKSSPVQNIISGSVWSKVSSGGNNTLGIKTDGTLWAWGEGNFGQLGNGLDGNENKTSSPIQIGNFLWKEVSAGVVSSAAIRSDGTLWTWGNNYAGILGNGTSDNKSSPVQVGFDNNWKQISNSILHVLAIRTDGTLWGWGEGNSGQLGQNDTVWHSSPVQITTDNDWKQVSATYSCSLAVKNDGTLWSWGEGVFGVLGNNYTAELSSPTQVGSSSDWASISGTFFNAVAVKTNGTLWAWGEGNSGAIGNGYTAIISSPVQVGTDSNWASAYAGGGNVAALKSDGTLWTWGNNYNGELGDGTKLDRSSPVQITSDKKWEFISFGGGNAQAITYGRIITESYALPKLTFKVKTYDPIAFASQLPPDGNVQNLIYQLKNQTVWIPGWPYPLKHDDTFILYGRAASDLRRKLPQINSGGAVLEIVEDVVPIGIHILINTKYVDYVAEPGTNASHEASNLIAFMKSESILYKTFEDISESTWSSVSSEADTIMIPEIERMNLLPDLTSGSRNVINNFVAGGGKLVMFDPDNGDVVNILNTIFGFSISVNFADEPISRTVDGANLFTGLSPTIPILGDTSSLDTSTLPLNSKTIYEGSIPNESVVTKIPYVSGVIYVLGSDWFSAAPIGSEDGGWNLLLQKILRA
jgi:alpha-tubulin suppressor-like RCC1 family protein